MSIINTVTSIISRGVADIVTNLKDDSATVTPGPDVNALGVAAQANVPTFGVPPPDRQPAGNPKQTDAPQSRNSTTGSSVKAVPNVLEKFSSYVPLWTLCSLTREQLNDPSLYRDKPVNSTSVVFASAGKYDKQRVQTFYGAPEYYIDNVIIDSLIGANPKTQNSSAHSFKFQIFEPYSMGLFLQSLQNAAKAAGHLNYLNNCPYLLRLDFQGWADDGTSAVVPSSSRYFPIRLVTTKFSCDESGSTYDVTAIPFNGAAFGDIINRSYTDLNIIGSTVKEALSSGENSLVRVINQRFAEEKTSGKVAEADQFYVVFPDSLGNSPVGKGSGENNNKATSQPTESAAAGSGQSPLADVPAGDNSISGSDLGFTLGGGGNPPFMKENETRDENGYVNREKVRINPQLRTMMFAQNQAISDIITEVVLTSEYVRKSAEQLRKNPDGTVDWFKLDAQIKLGKFDTVRRDYSKIIIFRVVPYRVHSSLFQNPTSAPQGYSQLEKLIAKKYQYVYSGQNDSILRFGLTFNNTFYTAVSSSPETQNKDVVDAGRQQASNEPQTAKAIVPGTGIAGTASKTGAPPVAPVIDSAGNRIPNASGTNDPRRIVAQDFHNAFINSDVDMIKMDIDIIGDPYFLVDSGMGNYFAQKYDSRFNADGSMEYEGGQVYVHISFRTVADIDKEKDIYLFQNGDKISPFGGIYRVINVSNEFTGGTFTQKLNLLRMAGQVIDFDPGQAPPTTGPTGMKTDVKVKDPRENLSPDSGYP